MTPGDLPATIGHGHAQGLADKLGAHVRVDRPADHPAAKEIDHRGAVEKAFGGVYVGQIAAPQLVGRLGDETAGDQVVKRRPLLGGDRRAHASASAATDDAGRGRQPGDAPAAGGAGPSHGSGRGSAGRQATSTFLTVCNPGATRVAWGEYRRGRATPGADAPHPTGGLATGTVEAPLKLAVRDALGQRPGESRRLEAREDLRDGRVRDAHRAGYGALRESRFEGEAQDLPGLPHGQSPVGHRALLVILIEESLAAASMRRFRCRLSPPRGAQKLFGLAWNRCSACRGISVRLGVE